jgi:Universal stress protein family
VVGIDGSEKSRKAAEYAISIAKMYNAALITICILTSDIGCSTVTLSSCQKYCTRFERYFITKKIFLSMLWNAAHDFPSRKRMQGKREQERAAEKREIKIRYCTEVFLAA